jgi:hypothetical protein
VYVGDPPSSDVTIGNRVGCRTVLVRSGGALPPADGFRSSWPRRRSARHHPPRSAARIPSFQWNALEKFEAWQLAAGTSPITAVGRAPSWSTQPGLAPRASWTRRVPAAKRLSCSAATLSAMYDPASWWFGHHG